ncbi:acetyl-CoA carboxylase biotin carboxyl carrier protein [Kitasatospora sp. YST-16]|uniref:acetyl-CoA carboxylase biotin carboxyl carrier protein n=1 Tax=unclassified Kitasatospora TaxID=2633591 RepID=UPI0004C432DA|nr:MULTISPECIES: acetyl-CoA carboxylase biotin carboxyl carrier protein [unclassified Kitasatospora]WAL75989.1 acetyl-CoA carboxylase biotin carboxyl carrier protein [Kitasatospora sp. YST-16]WNW42044.1 acetyl-CoA carboxylase biotin carboxyl carrier protein [Streptomyces sp. Li-HN-5-13]
MTVEVKHEAQRGRITLIGDGAVADPVADLTALCRSVAELARTTTRPPSRIRLEHLGTAVEVEWPVGEQQVVAAAPPAADEPPDEGTARHVRAPMVGTFYRSPEPGAPPFVSVGDTVAVGQPIGILEVMKMMSPVEADTAGRVVEILAEDGTPVEFQQRLIAVEPA